MGWCIRTHSLGSIPVFFEILFEIEVLMSRIEDQVNLYKQSDKTQSVPSQIMRHFFLLEYVF